MISGLACPSLQLQLVILPAGYTAGGAPYDMAHVLARVLAHVLAHVKEDMLSAGLVTQGANLHCLHCQRCFSEEVLEALWKIALK